IAPSPSPRRRSPTSVSARELPSSRGAGGAASRSPRRLLAGAARVLASRAMRDPRRFQEIRAEAESLAAALARDLEEAGDDPGAVDGLFRTAHSLKGFASLLDAAEAVRLADAIEDALDELRAGR